MDLTISLVLYKPSVFRLLAYALALDLDTLRSYTRDALHVRELVARLGLSARRPLSPPKATRQPKNHQPPSQPASHPKTGLPKKQKQPKQSQKNGNNRRNNGNNGENNQNNQNNGPVVFGRCLQLFLLFYGLRCSRSAPRQMMAQ